MTHEDDFFRVNTEEVEYRQELPDPLEDGETAESETASPDSTLLPGDDPYSSPEEVRKDADTSALSETQIPSAFQSVFQESERQGNRALGIRLRKSGQVFFFPDDTHTVRVGSKVIVELEQGPALGEVDSIIYGYVPPASPDDETQLTGKVTGLATAQDIALNAENRILCAEATAFCKTCIRQRNLDMKLVDVEALHDRSKIIFYFTAPSRIDFRELVKDLVRNYRTRIELRQIGVRHETQMIGGIGNCGMVCCCHKYLRKFAPVTIKMAKEQNLFLNPAKLSGMCGRLLCCLSFEQGNYEEFNRRCPKLGKKYTTDTGIVKVLRANMFSQSIVILSEQGEEVEMTLEEWDALNPHRAEPPAPEQQRAAALRSSEGTRKARPREHGRKAGGAFLPDSASEPSDRQDQKMARNDDSFATQGLERSQRSRKRRRDQED